MNTFIKLSTLIIALIVLLVLADYFALFGTREKKVLDFSIVHFKTIEENTGAPIFSPHITCYRHRNQDICQERAGKKKDTVSAYFPYHKVQNNTFLFTKSEQAPVLDEPDFKIMIIHSDYHNVVKDFDMNDIYQSGAQEMLIEMKPRNWGSSSEE